MTNPLRTIAHYRIISKLGEGGMGEVWHATDTKLRRDVAIKILPEAFARDPERLARFAREASVLASLNHPNIAVIHGLEENAIVMELVEGRTLSEQISGKPVAVPEALDIARQVVDALEYAHERGIVHRDLKPANVKITPEGRVKVLDFGLAKALSVEHQAAQNPADTPTLTLSGTEAGVVLGTPGYMSPEQARGLPADKRTDIWAFGAVVYEMLTGKKAFPGATLTDSLASILKSDPDWTALPAGTPGPVRRLIERCLDKDVKRRLRDIGEARIILEQPMPRESETNLPRAEIRNAKWPWIITAAAIVALLTLAVTHWRAPQPEPARLMRFTVDFGPDVPAATVGGAATLSPDGSRLVYVGRAPDGGSQLFTRTLDQDRSTPIPDTQNASGPFFSPDGQWVGFFAEFKLKKVRVAGGAPVALSEATSHRGGSWSKDGSIIAALDSAVGLFGIPQEGGVPQPVTRLSKENREVTHRWPQALGSEAVLFTSHVNRVNFDEATIEVQSLRNGVRKVLHRGGYYGRYVPARSAAARKGFLVYLQRSTLFAAPMNLDRLELTGPPVPILEGVKGNPDTGGAQFDFSHSGILVFQAGKPASQKWVLDWLDSSGRRQPLLTMPGSYSFPTISPDGSQIAIGVLDGAETDIWVYEWRRDRLSRLTFRLNRSPTSVCWFPDGKYLALSSDKHGGPGNIYWMRADGSGEMVRLIESPNQQFPSSLSPDGKRLAYIDFHLDTGLDIWTAPLDLSDPDRPKAGQPEAFLRTAAVETYPSFSPDGRWLAYMSTESGVPAIYVRSFPGPGGKWQIAPSGTMPVWSPNGRELFYRTPEDRRIMVAPFAVKGDAFVPEKPRLWSDKQIAATGVLRGYDVAPDGKRVAALFHAEDDAKEAPPNHLTFMVNFLEEVQSKLLPGAKAP